MSRASLVLTAGGAGIALPFIGVGSAHAAPAGTHAPDSGSGAKAKAKPAAKAPSEHKAHGSGVYTVVHGDTLSGIARHKQVEGGWHKLYETNRKTVGGDPDLILPGQKLTLSGDDSGPKPQGGAAPRPAPSHTTPSHTSYGNNLDGWIRQSLDIMKSHSIPGTYNGIHRNIMRESSGNPNAVNNWDSNAQNGTPSKGLLQTIQPTFDAYHVAGTSTSMTDPVANIVAACNYAAAQYGSIDNVNGPY